MRVVGRPRKILAMNNRHFTNAEIEERHLAESTFKSGREQLKPPKSLSARAKAEFERIVQEAHWLDNLDRNDLILYCFYWDKALSVVESYDSCPEIMEIQSGDSTSKMISNPLRKAIKDYHAEMRAISLKLGISSIDRLKLVAPKTEKPKNKFLEGLENG